MEVPRYSLTERDRRWALSRQITAAENVQALIAYGGPGAPSPPGSRAGPAGAGDLRRQGPAVALLVGHRLPRGTRRPRRAEPGLGGDDPGESRSRITLHPAMPRPGAGSRACKRRSSIRGRQPRVICRTAMPPIRRVGARLSRAPDVAGCAATPSYSPADTESAGLLCIAAYVENSLFCRDEVRRTSSVCSDSARRSADLRPVEVRQALAARQRVRRLAPIAERDRRSITTRDTYPPIGAADARCSVIVCSPQSWGFSHLRWALTRAFGRRRGGGLEARLQWLGNHLGGSNWPSLTRSPQGWRPRVPGARPLSADSSSPRPSLVRTTSGKPV